MNLRNTFLLALLTAVCPLQAQEMTDTVESGLDVKQTLAETTGSVAMAQGDKLNKRGSYNISNELFGTVLGLQTLQKANPRAAQTIYLRGVQTSGEAGSAPLILVDGIERDITYVTPEDVDKVTVLKDAAATALYGYKGANGVVLITTKRGIANTKSIKLTYDHSFSWYARKPTFVDAPTFGSAVNEALTYQGMSPRYTSTELGYLQSGAYPYQYPNVNWVDETFRSVAQTDNASLTFRGGTQKFRYYNVFNFRNNSGFVKNPNENDGYSTQDKYQRLTFRTNWDIDLTERTLLRANVYGYIGETNSAGASADLWSDIYSINAAAFPVKTEDGLWGGTSSLAGTLNPVGQSTAAGYSKTHYRGVMADMTLRQDLSSWVKGLAVTGRIAYDHYSTIAEDHSRTYVYGMNSVSTWNSDGTPATYNNYKSGKDGLLGSDADLSKSARLFNFYGSADYQNQFGPHSLYGQLRWDYEWKSGQAINTTFYRQNASAYLHYGYAKRYYADLSLVASASNKLATGHKWHVAPAIAAAWVISREPFMARQHVFDFLKLRASWGMQYVDNLPVDDNGNSIWNYWQQRYSTNGTGYLIDDNYSASSNTYKIGRLKSSASGIEKAIKWNAGIDATLFHDLSLTIDAFYQQRKDIWVLSTGKYTSVVGLGLPFEPVGQIDSYGVELGLQYHHRLNKDWALTAGANISRTGSEIKEMLEQPRLYDNLVQTGNRLGQVYGYEAIGLFKDEADIANSPQQSLGSTPLPGDIKYRDVNGDNVINENDKVALGYSTTCPELYYAFNLGAAYKDFGIDALFQGAGRYSAILSTKAVYRPLLASTNLSQDYYDNRWTPENTNAKYPRLSYQSNANNSQVSSFWLKDRSFVKLRYVELYYNLPQQLLSKAGFINRARLYVRGTDLFCADHINDADPETYATLTPASRSLLLGVSLNF